MKLDIWRAVLSTLIRSAIQLKTHYEEDMKGMCSLSPAFWSFKSHCGSDSIGECEESNCVSDSWQHDTSDHLLQTEWISTLENESEPEKDKCQEKVNLLLEFCWLLRN